MMCRLWKCRIHSFDLADVIPPIGNATGMAVIVPSMWSGLLLTGQYWLSPIMITVKSISRLSVSIGR